MKEFNYVSLFSGIGGFEQALNKLGGNCVMASEIDRFANQSYEILYGHSTAGDVTKVAAEDVPDHDLLVGGFPCQAFSVAGKRLGFDDTRGTLFFEIARIAKVKRPRAILLENVKGLISHDNGKTLDIIVQTLNDMGYTVDFEVINSKFFDVPQNRERVFIVALRNDLVSSPRWGTWYMGDRKDVVAKGKKRIELTHPNAFNFDWPSQETVTVRLRDILESDVDEKFYLSEEKTAKLVAQLNTEAPNAPGESEPQMLGHIDLRGHDAIKRVYSAEGVSPTLTTMGGGHREPKIAEEQAKSRYLIRKLTPRECFRLQGFPDSEFDKLSANGISNSQLYKQAGNAVTVNVIDAIGRRLLDYVNKEAN